MAALLVWDVTSADTNAVTLNGQLLNLVTDVPNFQNTVRENDDAMGAA